jgi:transposase
MMGRQSDTQQKLFYTRLNLDKRIRQDHVLRKINSHIDFDFIYKQVEDLYGSNGNVSVPPPVILKMMFLLIFYNVRSERELMQTIPERLDWLWFLGYDLDDDIPNHSVLSKARLRWGKKVFKYFFEHIVLQCANAGLVDGSKIFTDASLVQADASNNSVINQHSLKRYLNKSYRELEARLEQEKDIMPKKGKANRKHISTTDPDATVARAGADRSKLQYKVHRAVDERAEVITATDVTTGETNEAHLLTTLIDQHEVNTSKQVKTAVADSKYGTIDNYLACHDRNIASHFEKFDKGHDGFGTRKGIFRPPDFVYKPDEDHFICPAGKLLKPSKLIKKRNHYEYSLPAKVCNSCSLKPQCTRSKTGRTLKRHVRQEELDKMLVQSESLKAKRDIRKRQHLMERSYARSKRYGYKRARWRRLWRVQIQEYLTANIQNIMILIKYIKEQDRAASRMRPPMPTRHLFRDLFLNVCSFLEKQILSMQMTA